VSHAVTGAGGLVAQSHKPLPPTGAADPSLTEPGRGVRPCGSEPQSGEPGPRVGVVACGALALHVRAIAARRGWDVDVHPLPPALHNRPERIPPAVRRTLEQLRPRYARVAVAFADCGTRGALDDVVEAAGVTRLRGDTCYDVLALDEVHEALAEEPGTYFLTDFLVRTFERSVVRALGLDRHPELRDAYFGHYTRVVWLAQRPTPALRRAARSSATRIGLPLEERHVGDAGLERELEALVTCTATGGLAA
jgi:hypothetical protein